MKNDQQQILDQIKASESILILPSSPPDGDSLGAATALYLALRKIGKNATVVCADPVPDVYQFLPEINQIHRDIAVSPDFIVTIDTADIKNPELQSRLENNKINIILTSTSGCIDESKISFSHGPAKYDLLITVDTADLQQLGKFYLDNLPIFTSIPLINIDHHSSNENFGHINYLDITSSSTCEMILGLLELLEEQRGEEIIDQKIATSLLAGVITDTGSFQHSNTNPKSFANAAKLIKRGAEQQEIIQKVYKTKNLSMLRLWGRVLSNIKVDKSHRFLWSTISQSDLQQTGSSEDESGNIIDELMTNAPEVDLVLLLKEKKSGQLSGSLRAVSPGVDVSLIATEFGGGGHTKAAGFKISDSSLQKDGQRVIETILKIQSRRLNLTEEHSETEALNSGYKTVNQLTSSTANQVNDQSSQVHIKSEQAGKDNQLSEKPVIKKEQVFQLKTGEQNTLEPGVIYKFEK